MPRVLVIDDDERIRSLLCSYLEHAGFAVEDTASGAEGLRLARQTPRTC
jgi:DNA-binding response OmpR family regulator